MFHLQGESEKLLCAIMSTCMEANRSGFISLPSSCRAALPQSLPRRGLKKLSHTSSSISVLT
ncbi:hypothetical protein INR49_027073 [Caranx melampygus]|nr:hypothetical protein INR49_027073 [Caranx melampygus]